MTLLNLGCGPHRLEGFENLDAETGWRFQDGLPYPNESVEGATCSHALMFLPLPDWPPFFAELARVLEPGGIVRITEDDTENPESERFGGFPGALALTGPKVVRLYLREAGFRVRTQTATSTGFRDGSLLQAWHGAAPKVFWIEGRKV